MTIDPSVHFAGFILAGGRSSRMGRDKAQLEIDGVTMLDHAVALLNSAGIPVTVVGSPADFARRQDARAIADEWPGAGPLGGIATALRGTPARWNLVIACDMPYLTKEWLKFLLQRASVSNADAVVPANDGGPESLCSVYNQRAEATICEALENGTRKVTDALAKLQIDYVERAEWKAFDSDGRLFKNMNRPGDYDEAKAILSGRAKI